MHTECPASARLVLQWAAMYASRWIDHDEPERLTPTERAAVELLTDAGGVEQLVHEFVSTTEIVPTNAGQAQVS